MTFDEFLTRLNGVKKAASGSRATALCPAHPDHNPSLSVARADDGRVLIRCYAGCEVREIVRAVDLHLRDLFPRGRRGRRGHQR